MPDPSARPARSWPARLWHVAWRTVLGAGIFYFGMCLVCLTTYRYVFPLTTGVQLQRRVAAWADGRAFTKRYAPVPRAAIDDDLPLAVVAAEDTRFFQHAGIDWAAVEEALEDNARRDDPRGASTISQQLVKNLFLTTHSTWLRKGLEVPLVYMAELVLSKERILTLYLNVVEWGPEGIFGAEAAARFHYNQPAARLTRYQAAALAAILPNPRERRPYRMDWYTRIILQRMHTLQRISPHL